MCVNSLLLPLFPLSSLLTGIPSVEEMARIRNKYHILTKKLRLGLNNSCRLKAGLLDSSLRYINLMLFNQDINSSQLAVFPRVQSASIWSSALIQPIRTRYNFQTLPLVMQLLNQLQGLTKSIFVVFFYIKALLALHFYLHQLYKCQI